MSCAEKGPPGLCWEIMFEIMMPRKKEDLLIPSIDDYIPLFGKINDQESDNPSPTIDFRKAKGLELPKWVAPISFSQRKVIYDASIPISLHLGGWCGSGKLHTQQLRSAII